MAEIGGVYLGSVLPRFGASFELVFDTITQIDGSVA
jgi:hypothetical protein